jgi:Amt family ammonium transporter
MTKFGRLALCAGGVMAAILTPSLALAADAPALAEVNESDPAVIANSVWVLIAGMLVFFMNAGFATLEAGLCRRKNAVNILAKNFIVFGISSIAFWVVGFGLMFGNGSSFVGTSGFAPDLLTTAAPPGTVAEIPETASAEEKAKIEAANAEIEKQNEVQAGYTFSSLNWANLPISIKFFFQLVFAGTAATIVSGAVAERIKFIDFIIFSFILVGFIYPITGHWVWGGGWLSVYKQGETSVPFHDFAGSTVVHSVGGWAALAGVLLLGPRIGKYAADGKVNAIPGHNMGLASLGCLILWLGWFGFNPGSTMTASTQIGHIAVTTNTAAAFGAVAATATAWLLLGKPDLGMVLNGCLAGLVGITAPCAVVSVAAAAIIGAVAGVLVVFSVLFWDKLKIDDPVGALSVHLVCGVWGTLAVGLFASEAVIKKYAMGAYCMPGLLAGGGAAQLISQLVGVAAVGGLILVASLVVWAVLKFTLGIRVSEKEELEGLDIGEHGMEAYPGFATDSISEATVGTAATTGKGVAVTA